MYYYNNNNKINNCIGNKINIMHFEIKIYA